MADPKCRCAGAGRPRWILESPRSALPGPCQLSAVGGAGVGDELSVDDVGDPSLEAAHGFHRRLAVGSLASVVGAAFGVEAERWPRRCAARGSSAGSRPARAGAGPGPRRRTGPAPALAGREPADQPHDPHRRGHPDPPRHRRPGLLPTQARRRQEPMEAMRCLKRRISDAVYRQLVADARTAPTATGDAGPGGHCGASQESSAVDLPPHIDTSDQPLPGPAKPTLQPPRRPGRAADDPTLTSDPLTTEGSRNDAHAGSINRTRRWVVAASSQEKVGYLEGVATVSVAPRWSGLSAVAQPQNSSGGIYGPLLDWARRSPLHAIALSPVPCEYSRCLAHSGVGSARRSSIWPAGPVHAAARISWHWADLVRNRCAIAGAATAEMSGIERRIGAGWRVGRRRSNLLGSLIAQDFGPVRSRTRLALAGNVVMAGAGFLGGHLALNRGRLTPTQPLKRLGPILGACVLRRPVPRHRHSTRWPVLVRCLVAGAILRGKRVR